MNLNLCIFRTPEEKDVAEKKFMQVQYPLFFALSWMFPYSVPKNGWLLCNSQVATAYETLREDESRADYDYMLVGTNGWWWGLPSDNFYVQEISKNYCLIALDCRITPRRCGETCTGITEEKAQKWTFDWFSLSQSHLYLLVSSCPLEAYMINLYIERVHTCIVAD